MTQAAPHLVILTPTPPDISAFGIRSLSAYLKSQGFRVSLVFLPGGIEDLQASGAYVYQYPQSVIDHVLEISTNADLIGISFLSQYLDRAIQLTKALKSRLSAPIIWGGVHATLRPESSLNYADLVCIGEGEASLLALLERYQRTGRLEATPGIWSKHNGTITRTVIPPVIDQLDSLPGFDFSLIDHYILDPREGRIKELTVELLKTALPLMPYFNNQAITVYRTMTSRGCPHACTYCVNQALAKLTGTERYLRFRSPEHVIAELTTVLAQYPFIQGIHFFDDVFTSMPRQHLNRLCELYQNQVHLPFYCQVSPSVINRQMMELLIDSGMVFIEMGIQTGNERIRQLYQRHETTEQIIAAARLFTKYRGRLLTTRYHLILDNPWETPAETVDTLKLLVKLPRPFILCLSSLTLYPGTPLNQIAHEEGWLTDEVSQVYRKPFYRPSATYLNWLIISSDIGWIPRWFLHFLSRPLFIKLFQRREPSTLIKFLIKIDSGARLVHKGLVALVTGDYARLARYRKRVH